jgi:hypothetical protein
LVASTIMVVALLGVAAILPTADQTIHYGGQKTKAVSMAQSMVEMIKNDRFNDISDYNGVDTRTPSTFGALTDVTPLVVGNTGSFLGNSNVVKWRDDISTFLSGPGVTSGYGTVAIITEAKDGTGAPLLRKVVVTVGWTDSGRDYKVSLTTLISGI